MYQGPPCRISLITHGPKDTQPFGSMAESDTSTRKEETEALFQVFLQHLGAEELKQAKLRKQNVELTTGLFYLSQAVKDTEGLRQACIANHKILKVMIDVGLKGSSKLCMRSALNRMNKVHDLQLFDSVKQESWALRQYLNHIRYTEKRVMNCTRLPGPMSELVLAQRKSLGKEEHAIVIGDSLGEEETAIVIAPKKVLHLICKSWFELCCL